MKKKQLLWMLTLSATFLFLGCNAAEGGFNAPDGSTITFSPATVTVTAPATGVAGSSYVSSLALATIRVSPPIGSDVSLGNKISGVIVSGGPIIYKFHDDVATFLPLPSLVDQVAAGTMPFTTDSRGLFTFAFSVVVSYDESGDLVTGDQSISGDLGVTEGSITVSVGS